jgi:chromosome segregation ATPase
MQQEVALLSEKLSQNQAQQVADLRDDLQALQYSNASQQQAMQHQIAADTQQLTALKSELQALQRSNSSQQQTMQQQTSQQETMQQQIATDTQQLAALKTELQMMQHHSVNEFNEIRTSSTGTQQQLEARLEARMNNIVGEVQKLAAMESASNSTKSELEMQVATLKDKLQQNKAESTSTAALKNELHLLQESSASELNAIKRTSNSSQSEVAELAMRVAALDLNVKNHDDAIGGVSNVSTSLQTKFDNKIAAVASSIQQNVGYLAQFSARVEQLEATVSRSTADMQQLSAIQTASKSKEKDDLEALDRKLQQSSKEMDDLYRYWQEFQQQTASVDARLKSVEQSSAVQIQGKNNVQNEVDVLHTKLAQMQSELTILSVSSGDDRVDKKWKAGLETRLQSMETAVTQRLPEFEALRHTLNSKLDELMRTEVKLTELRAACAGESGAAQRVQVAMNARLTELDTLMKQNNDSLGQLSRLYEDGQLADNRAEHKVAEINDKIAALDLKMETRVATLRTKAELEDKLAHLQRKASSSSNGNEEPIGSQTLPPLESSNLTDTVDQVRKQQANFHDQLVGLHRACLPAIQNMDTRLKKIEEPFDLLMQNVNASMLKESIGSFSQLGTITEETEAASSSPPPPMMAADERLSAPSLASQLPPSLASQMPPPQQMVGSTQALVRPEPATNLQRSVFSTPTFQAVQSRGRQR